jgi:hypothetical protein
VQQDLDATVLGRSDCDVLSESNCLRLNGMRECRRKKEAGVATLIALEWGGCDGSPLLPFRTIHSFSFFSDMPLRERAAPEPGELLLSRRGSRHHDRKEY